MQDLNGAADFVVTADHRIELALLGALGHVDGVLVQRLTRLLGIGVIDRRATAQVADGVLQGLLAHALGQQELAQTGVVVQRGKQYQFARDVLVALLLGEAIGLVEQTRQILRQVHVTGGVLQLGQLVQLLGQGLAQRVDVEADLHQQGLDRTALLLQQSLHQVQRLDGRVIQANGNGLGIGERKLKLAGQSIDTHGCSSSGKAGRHHESRLTNNPRDGA